MSTLEEDEPKYEEVGICHKCKHRVDVMTCDAFPQGIPVEILAGEIDHTKPYEGDNGIQFEPVEEGD